MLGILKSFLASIYSILRLIYWYGEAIFRFFIPPPFKTTLVGETILVTGGASGIGRAFCRHLTSSTTNTKLVVWDVDRRGLDSLAQELQRNARGVRVFVYQVDISKRENIHKAAALVKQDVGPVSVLINNAGIGPLNKFMDLEDSEIEQTLQINLFSHLWILRAFLGDMMSANHGRIMNISSLAALMPSKCALPYITSKAGVVGYGEALKAELEYFGYDGIHVTTVFPSVTRTPMIRSLAFVEKELAGVPSGVKTAMEPEEVARVAVDGMRRELEFVYFPQSAGALAAIDCLVPLKQRKVIRAKFARVITFNDPEERRRMEEGGRKPTAKGN